MAMKLRNKTSSAVLLNDLNGIEIPANSDLDFDSGIDAELAYSVDLASAINSNLVVLVDGGDVELSKTQSLNITDAGYDISIVEKNSMLKAVYDITDSGVVDNAEKVNNLTVSTAVPSNAIFTDTVYDDTAIQAEVDLNTAKVGITSQQSSDITTNNAKVSYTDASLVSQHTTDISNIETKTDFISVSQAVNLDTMESDIALEKKRGRISGAVGTGASIVSFTSTAVSIPLGELSLGNSFCSIDVTGTTGEITFNESATVVVNFNLSITGSSTNRSTSKVWMELNGTQLNGTLEYMYHRTTTNDKSSTSSEAIITVVSGDKVRIRAVRDNGSSTLKTIPDSVYVKIMTV